MIKPLIIGFGLAGSRHLKAQLDLGIETGVYNIRPKKTKILKTNPKVVVFDDLDEALNWSNLVHVCTPDDKHTEYVEKALKKGKAVFCEKPLTTNLKEALHLQDLAHKNNSILIVAQNYRLTPSFLETQKRVSEKTLGKITNIETTYLDDMTDYRLGTKWRNQQDFLYAGGLHAIDLARWIMDEEVVAVQAAVGKKIRTEYKCPERYQIILKFASGVLGHISLDASSARAVDGSDLIVNGEDGFLASHNKLDNLLYFKKEDRNTQTIYFPNSQTLTTALEVRIIDDFLMDKNSSHWPLPNVDEAVKVIKILATIQKAVLTGKSEKV